MVITDMYTVCELSVLELSSSYNSVEPDGSVAGVADAEAVDVTSLEIWDGSDSGASEAYVECSGASEGGPDAWGAESLAADGVGGYWGGAVPLGPNG